MTTPVNSPDELSPPPELKLLVTDNLDPSNAANKGPSVNWIVDKQHPFMPSMTVEAMFVSRNAAAVYVYSASKDIGARDVIPMHRVRLAHERMAHDVLAEEINATAAGDDPYVYNDKDDEDEDDDTPDSTPAVESPPNGQPSP